MQSTSLAGADVECGQLVAHLIATPTARLALLNSTCASTGFLLQKVLEVPSIRDHFSDRCVFVSCDGATSTDVVVACLASGLGLEPQEDAIGVVLEDLMAHRCTLIVLDNLDVIHASADPEQQEPTDVMLATLASVDQLSLVVTLRGQSQPDCVDWISVGDNDDPDKAELQAVVSSYLLNPTTTLATVSRTTGI